MFCVEIQSRLRVGEEDVEGCEGAYRGHDAMGSYIMGMMRAKISRRTSTFILNVYVTPLDSMTAFIGKKTSFSAKVGTHKFIRIWKICLLNVVESRRLAC